MRVPHSIVSEIRNDGAFSQIRYSEADCKAKGVQPIHDAPAIGSAGGEVIIQMQRL